MLKQLFYCTLLTLLLTSCKGRWYKMETTAMEPNIPTWGSVSIQEQKYYSYGDVVLIDKIKEYPIMYRIVALSGDSVAIEDNVCVLNGKKFSTEFINTTLDQGERTVHQIVEKWTNGINLTIWIEENIRFKEGINMPTIRVPDDHIFVLGDNRTDAFDSRIIGPIPLEKIKGKVIKVKVK